MKAMTAIGAGLCSLILAACGGSDSPATETPPAETRSASGAEQASLGDPYVIGLRATSRGPRVIRVRGKTNLPDGALVTVVASRAFRFGKESDVRAVNVGSAAARVSDGSFRANLRLDEGTLLVGLEPNEPVFGPVEVVDQAVTVCAQFRTGQGDGKPIQAPAVIEAVGENGENLEDSPQAFVFGSATEHPSTWLEAETRVRLPSPLLAEIAEAQGTPAKSRKLTGFCLA